jgi:hypothetical protein
MSQVGQQILLGVGEVNGIANGILGLIGIIKKARDTFQTENPGQPLPAEWDTPAVNAAMAAIAVLENDSDALIAHSLAVRARQQAALDAEKAGQTPPN